LGEGRVVLREEVNVDIPAGVHFGAQLRLEGKGTEGLPGHRNGDLFLHLEPRDISGFRRDGLDLHGSCSIAPELARNGGDVVVELPRGRVKVKVPVRTCVGDRFRLKGQGVPAYLGHEVGDVYLTVKVDK
jgi:molecular chaperone DnaJ